MEFITEKLELIIIGPPQAFTTVTVINSMFSIKLYKW